MDDICCDKKIFAVSDIHGHAALLKMELLKHGFVPNSSSHLLVVCGDCFDRGNESKELFEFLSTLSNKVIVRGNHEEMLMDAIKRECINISDIYNGTEITIEDLFGADSIDRMGRIHITDDRRKQVLDYLLQTVDYFETQNYVFVHGWIPPEDWRNASPEAWSDARWMGWTEMYDQYNVKDKILICGHRAAKHAHTMDRSRTADDNSPYFGGHFIAIDSNTVRSKTINVLVIEDEPYCDEQDTSQ